MNKVILFVLSLFLLTAAMAAPAKVESIEALKEASVADAIKSAVEDKGWRAIGEDGKTISEIWLAKKVETTTKEVMGANFGNIPEGTFLGVIHFPADTSDYRGQVLKAGYYTMRYALILENGAHLGVSPTRDFFLLGKVEDDKDPKSLTQSETIKLSTKASGTGHPSAWSIVSASSKDGLPKIVKTDEGHVMLELKISGMAMGLTLIGKTEG